MLSDVLIQDLIIKLKWVFLSQFIVQFSTVWFNNITFAWGWAVSKWIFTSLDVASHDLLVITSAVLQLDKSLSGWIMFHIIRTSTIKLIHYLIETIRVSVVSIVHHFREKLVKLRLNVISSLLEILVLKLSIYSWIDAWRDIDSHFWLWALYLLRLNLWEGYWRIG